MRGFLGTQAGLGADLNLIIQVAMGIALIAGAILARAKRYRAHGACQATVLLLNLLMIGFVMWPAFHRQVLPRLPRHFGKPYYVIATIHGILGAAAELLGLYIVLVAGTTSSPRRGAFGDGSCGCALSWFFGGRSYLRESRRTALGTFPIDGLDDFSGRSGYSDGDPGKCSAWSSFGIGPLCTSSRERRLGIFMAPCEVVLKARKELCDRTAAFFFEKPAGFEFKAGQFANFTLLDGARTDGERNTRSFSIASAPCENDLMVAMRMRETAFKRGLAALPMGAHVLLQGPFGNLTLHGNAARPAVFLAGGIGITPFRSMIWHATEARSPHKIFLFYSIRRPEEAAFLEDLRRMASFNRGYEFIPTVTQPVEAKLPWQGETGYITQEMLASRIGDLKDPIYYIAGPPGMVVGMRQTLSRAGLSDDDMRTEQFAGY